MNRYELMAIFPLEEDRSSAGREQMLTDLGANGAEIEKTDEIGDRDLAYEVKRARRGRYVLFTIKLTADKPSLLERAFKLNANLLKYLFVKIK